ncbi:MAG: PEP-CTERM sorting domain-containing protein [Verrucomicrobia bacterium]|nr:PEP-CTERM sorting domain-containing protein [Verrucomicrobiota bacterium]
MSTKLRVLATLGGIAVASMVVSQAANLLSNGDFESPDLSTIGATQATYGPGQSIGGVWTVSGANVGLYTDAWDLNPNQVIADEQSLYFDVAGAAISQTVSLSPGSYTLSFKAAALNTGTYRIAYTVVGNGGAPGGTAYVPYNIVSGTTLAPNFDSYLASFTVGTADNVMFTFMGISEDPQAALDDVSLVPEPETYALVAGLGLMLFAGYRRFRKA